MTKLNIGRFKILNACIIIFICLVLCGCGEEPPLYVIPDGGLNYKEVYYTYLTYEEMIAASEKCELKSYSFQFDLDFPEVQEYSYHLKGIKPGGKKTDDEEITDNVVLYEHIIAAKFTEERKFSIHFGIFSDKSSLEERLQGILEWESNPLYDDYEDFTRYYLRNRTQHLFVPCEIAFKGPFENELIQQVLDYIYASILSQIVE